MLGGSAHLCGKASTKTNVHRVDSLSGGFDSGERGGIQNLGLVVFCEWISFILRLRIRFRLRLRLGGTSFLAVWLHENNVKQNVYTFNLSIRWMCKAKYEVQTADEGPRKN